MKSIKTLALATAVVAAPLMLTACGGEGQGNEWGNGTNVNYHDITTTMSGHVRDAQTLQPITTATLKLYQGSDIREAKFNKKEDGYYVISGIPSTTNNNITYKVKVSAEGYQDLWAAVAFPIGSREGLQDETVFKLANVNLYPVGAKAASYQVTVTYNNKRAANQVVELTYNNTTANTLNNPQANMLTPLAGTETQTKLTATTDADGVATFAGSSLVLGASYTARVPAAVVDGIDVENFAGATFTVGTANKQQTLALSKISVGVNEGLYVTKASNESDLTVTPTGALVLTFSKPVEVVTKGSAVFATDAVDNANINQTATYNGYLANPSASVSVSGNVVTVTPGFVNGKSITDTSGKNTRVTYSGLVVRLADGTNKSFNVFGGTIVNSSGITISGEVHITPIY